MKDLINSFWILIEAHSMNLYIETLHSFIWNYNCKKKKEKKEYNIKWNLTFKTDEGSDQNNYTYMRRVIIITLCNVSRKNKFTTPFTCLINVENGYTPSIPLWISYILGCVQHKFYCAPNTYLCIIILIYFIVLELWVSGNTILWVFRHLFQLAASHAPNKETKKGDGDCLLHNLHWQ